MGALIERCDGVLHRSIRTTAIVSVPDGVDVEITGISVLLRDALDSQARRSEQRSRIKALHPAHPPDIDLDERIDTAIAVLEHHGATRRIPERRPGFDRRFERSIGMQCPDLVEIDIH